MGISSYNILSDKLAPTKPLEADYKQIVDTLASYYEPKSYELVELYKFHKRYQKESESVEEFVTDLRKMASTCNFGDYLQTSIRNQCVFGLKCVKSAFELSGS
jgi:hypothetical protein